MSPNMITLSGVHCILPNKPTLRNSEILKPAKEKFPEVATDDFYFCESDGSIIEENIIMDYIFQKRDDNLTLYIRKHHDEHYGNLSN